jgi:phage-related protein
VAGADYTLKVILDAEDKASKTVRGLQGELEKTKDGLASIGKGIAVGLGGIAVAGLGALTAGLISSTKEAMQAQAVQAQLAAVLASTGGKAGVTADAVNALSAEIQRLTPFEDDAVTSAQSMMLTFTNIGKDVFPQATWAVTDMAQAMGMDLQNAAIMVGKALNDPIQGVGALRRVGVQLTDDQEKLIKKLVETGDVAGAQKIILSELTTEFGGSAEAAGKTFAGQLDRLKNAFSDVREEIGGAVLPVLQQFAEKALQYLASPEVQAGIRRITQAIADFAQQVITQLPLVIDWIGSVVEFLQNNRGVVVGIFAALGVAVGAFVYTTVIPAMVAMVASFAPVLAIMAVVGAAVYLLYKAWSSNFLGIRNITAQIWTAVKSAFDQVKAWLQVSIPAALQTLQSVWAACWNAIREVVNAVWPIIMAVYRAFRAAFEGDWYGFGEKLRQAWSMVWQLIRQILADAWSAIKTIISNLIANVSNAFVNTNWVSIGKSIIAGITNGVKAAASSLAEAAKNAAKAAMDAVAGFLGIKSPSTVFETQIGKNMMAGWVKGVERMTPRLELAVANASGQAMATSVANYYNLTVQSIRSAEQIERDFWLMRG